MEFRIIVIILFFTCIQSVALGQHFADKGYYLVDSLNLDEITPSDKKVIDSTLRLYHAAKHDTGKIMALSIACENMMHQDWSKYQRHQHNMILDAMKKDSSLTMWLKKPLADALNNLGYIYYYQEGGREKGMEYFLQCLQLQEEINDEKGLGTSYSNIGFIYNSHGDVKKALEYYHKGLKIRERLNDKKGMGYSFNNIGSIYMTIGNEELALDYYQKSKKIREEIDDKQGVANSLDNIGGIYKSQKKYNIALDYYNKALNIQHEIGFLRGASASLENIGSIYLLENKTDSALSFFREALRISHEINNKEGIANGYFRIGSAYLKQRKIDGPEGALSYAHKSHVLFENLKSPRDLMQSARLLSQIYELKGNDKEAYRMYKLFVKMSDSINNEETQKVAMQQQFQYEYEKKEQEMALEREKQRILTKARETKKNILIYAVIAVALICILFLLYVYNRYRVIRNQKHIIENQSDKINDSINYAKKIQDATLPSPAVFGEYFQDSFIYFKPKDVVSGDFYWLHKMDDVIFFSVIDCTGHGVPGAFMSLICNNLLDKVVAENDQLSPEKILTRIDTELTNRLTRNSNYEINDGMDLMLCCLDTTSNTLLFSGARHTLLHARNNQITAYAGDKINIGGRFIHSNPTLQRDFSLQTLQLEKDDIIYLFSDGYADQIGGEKGKKFYLSRFQALLEGILNEEMHKQKEIIDATHQQWKGTGNKEQIDDICILGLKI